MHRWLCVLSAALSPLAGLPQANAADPQTVFRIYVANDNCPDYTWGLDEKATRLAYANIVKGHLDAMAVTDKKPVIKVWDTMHAAICSSAPTGPLSGARLM